ncbi:pyocin activator PrtN family protein [Acinetobacter lwoffii]|uniref:pyocin activator PrtN family protein n=1 Tax=Acinetobacter lwoffii TaxID=28090 RepID=UPI00209AD66E|nr:pyocin activator PrtN family protein [Acinetobacter lwoffii]MCO8073032.1 pyocin activator PrtN family protein [Acinetobacter lwoffii]MCO8076154.1 pyocin activator PrtN family protein [Acinetobacter lwoffii]
MNQARSSNKANQLPSAIDIGLMLAMQYKRAIIPLALILEDYMPHLSIKTANQRASKCDLPFPCFKIDGERSEYFVHLTEIATWLESLQKSSKKDWENMHC